MKTILINPFEKYSEKQLIISGSIITLIGSLIAMLFNARFDGVLDLHFVRDSSFTQALLDNLINIIVLSLFLFAVSQLINQRTRFIDILSVSIISRTPYYLLPALNINDSIQIAGEEIQKITENNNMDLLLNSGTIVILLFALLSLAFLVWYIGLLYNGFKVAANAKGTKSIVLFAIALLFAEIASKYIIHTLN